MPTAKRPPIPLSPDVVAYIKEVFAQADRHVSGRLTRMPTSHEEWLDFSLIDAIGTARGPHVTPSRTLVDFQIHFVGSGWHYQRWEVADIGLLINFRTSSKLLRTKVAMLQSKRVYPIEQEFTELHGTVYRAGFESLMDSSLPAAEPRSFRFEANSRYKALQIGDDQWERIKLFEEKHGLPVHYCLYHPVAVPSTAFVPAVAEVPLEDEVPVVGTRVMAAETLRALVSELPHGHTPAFDELAGSSGAPGESISEFVGDKLLGCTEGHVVDGEDVRSDAGLRAVFTQRGAPIAAAIRVDIVLPDAP